VIVGVVVVVEILDYLLDTFQLLSLLLLGACRKWTWEWLQMFRKDCFKDNGAIVLVLGASSGVDVDSFLTLFLLLR
jgi:hypothetical protein